MGVQNIGSSRSSDIGGCYSWGELDAWWPQNVFLGRNVHSVAENRANSGVLWTQNANMVGETHSVSIG